MRPSNLIPGANMSISAILDLVIGLSFIYLLLALVVSGVVEMIAARLDRRGEILQWGIATLLDIPSRTDYKKGFFRKARELFIGLSEPAIDKIVESEKAQLQCGKPLCAKQSITLEQVYAHPLIKSLRMHGSNKLPSYIPPKHFAAALIDLASRRGQIDKTARSVIDALPNGSVKTALGALHRDAGSSVEQLETSIVGWYEETMERVSGWYKRRTQVWLVLIGIVSAVVLNVDSIHIAKTLWSNPAIAAALAEDADSLLDEVESENDDGKSGQAAKAALNAMESSYPSLIGWTETVYKKQGLDGQSRDFDSVVLATLGWLLTGLLASLGAPFWMNALNRLLSIRNSGPKPEDGAAKKASDKFAQ